MNTRLATIILILSCVGVRATDHLAASTSAADVQAAVNACANGDRAIVPSGSATWSTTVTITNGITLIGGGGTNGLTTITQGGSAGQCILSVNVTTLPWAVIGGGFDFVESYSVGGGEAAPNTYIILQGNYRFCSNTIDTLAGGAGITLFTSYSFTNELVDDCFVKEGQGNTFSPYGEGFARWNYGPDWGGRHKVYIENCTGYCTSDVFINDGFIDGYDGAAVAIRNCTITNSCVGGMHGADSSGTSFASGHSAEIYSNTFVYNTANTPYWVSLFQFRGGTALIHDNSIVGYVGYSNDKLIALQYFRISNTSDIGNWPVFPSTLWDTYAGPSPTGYPGFEQPGTTGPYTLSPNTQTMSPVYIWNNTPPGSGVTPMVTSDNSATLTNRDYYMTAAPGYTPLAYPYPGTGNSGTPAIQVVAVTTNYLTNAIVVSTTNSFTVTNTGTGTLSGSVQGVSAPFVTTSGGSFSLGAGLGQATTIAFEPTVPGSFTNTVTFNGGSVSTNFNIIGVATNNGAVILVTAASTAFGTTLTGTSVTNQFFVTNVGIGTLAGTVTSTAPFSISAGGTYSLTANQGQSVSVVFGPTSAGNFTNTVAFTSYSGSNITVTGTATNAPGALFVQNVGFSSTYNNNSVTEGGVIRCPTPNLTIPGNAIVVGIQYADTGSTKFTCGDNAGNKYYSVCKGRDTANNQGFTIFLCTNNVGSARVVTLTNGISYSPNWVQMDVCEIPFVSVLDGTNWATGNSSAVAAGNITPSASGDWVYQYVVWDHGSQPTSFQPSSQANLYCDLLSGDLWDAWSGQVGTYSSSATISPTETMTPANNWITGAIALKRNPNEGANGTGMRIINVLHQAQSDSSGMALLFSYPPLITSLEFPSYGNLQVLMYQSGSLNAVATNITDTAGNTYHAAPGGVNNIEFPTTYPWYAENSTPNQTNMLKVYYKAVDLPDGDGTFMYYDIVNAPTTAFDGTRVTNVNTQTSVGNLTTTTIGPVNAGGIIFFEANWDNNTANGLTSGQMFDSGYFDGENLSGPCNFDENNGWGHVYCTNTAVQKITWSFVNGSTAVENWAADALSFSAYTALAPPSPNGLSILPNTVIYGTTLRGSQ